MNTFFNLFAITRVDVAEYLDALLWIYTILIIIRVLMSWLPSVPDNPVIRGILGFVEDVTEPYLSIWRRLIPPIGGGLDISPIVAILVLSIGGGIVVNLVAG